MNKNQTYLIKFIVVGSMGVGKSCLMNQFINQKFIEEHSVTIGVEFGMRTIPYQGHRVKIQIWDTAGQESFRSMTRSYYRASVAAFLVYDITRKDTFEDLQKWLEEARSNSDENLIILIIGNKSDCEEEREISFFEGEKFAKDNNCLFIETSAKTAHNVEQAFMEVTKLVFEKIERKEIDLTRDDIGVRLQRSSISLELPDEDDEDKRKCAC